MTLAQLSKEYEAAAVPLRRRLSQLRRQLKEETDPEKLWHLQRRIAELTARYYERGYYRNKKYTL